MKAQLLTMILTGLKDDPVRTRAELAGMGVRAGVVDRLALLDLEMVTAMAERAVIGINLDYEAIAHIHTQEELLADFLRFGATNDIIIELLGWTARDISSQRAAIGAPKNPGRPSSMDENSIAIALDVWKTAKHLPKARRLLAVHDKLPMWPLSSIYLAVRGK